MDKIQRSFIVGGEWLYYKLYTGTKTADTVLVACIQAMAAAAYEAKWIDRWFFIRYNDPDFHLRIRFHVTESEHLGKIMQAMYTALTPYVEEDLIWKLQLDTYQREIERYGEATMEASETVFFYDSVMITELITLLEDSEEGEELRWLAGLRAIDQLLTDFGYTADAKLALLEGLKTGFGKEFGMDKSLKKQLDKKYREQQEKIQHFLNLTLDTAAEYTPLVGLIDQKSKAIAQVVAQIQSQTTQRRLDNLLRSYIHMLMNRLFRSQNRLHEMVLYDLLYRVYKRDWGIRMYSSRK